MKKYLVLFILTGALIVGISLNGNSDKDVLVLSAKNTVSLNVPITEDSVKSLQVELMDKGNSLNASTPIILVLNSPGGSIDAGMKLIETAKGLRQPVNTLSMFSASMSFITSQYLGTRYAMGNSTLMSHRAYLGGVEGQIPGSFISRTNHILDALVGVDKFVANRAGLTLEGYEKAISNELWLDGKGAVDMKLADKVVRVRCDSTLQGPGVAQRMQVMMFTIKITYHKCPLITEPLSFEIENRGGLTAEADHVWGLYLNDKPKFIEEYIVNGKFNQYVK